MNRPEHPEQLLPFYVNGTLEGEEHRQVETHLRSCLVCRREVEALKALRSAVGTASRAEPPGEAGLDRLLAAIEGEETAAVPKRRFPRWWMQALAAMVVMTLGLVLWRPWGPQTPIQYRNGDDTLQLRSQLLPDEALPREAFVLRWEVSPATQGLRFAVRVTTEDLDLVVEARDLEAVQYRVTESTLALLEPGTRLHWQVTVVGPEGRPLVSHTFPATLE